MTEEKFVLGTTENIIDNKKEKRNYGNKYQKDKHTISVEDYIFKKLVGIQGKRTKGELLDNLVELHNAIEPLLEDKHECKKCRNDIDDIPINANLDTLRHCDIDKNSNCKGSISTKLKIKKDVNGIVIGNKLYHKHNEEDNIHNDCPFCKKELNSEDGINFKCIDCNKEFEFGLKEKISKTKKEKVSNDNMTKLTF